MPSYKSHFANVPAEHFISTEIMGISSATETGAMNVAKDKMFVLTDLIISPSERWGMDDTVLYHIAERADGGEKPKEMRFAYCSNRFSNWCHNFTTGLTFAPNSLIVFRCHRISNPDLSIYYQLQGYYASPAGLL